jgi:2-dehydropantoate 2-reductase
VRGTFDRILLCVKAHHTADATRMLAPHLDERGAVVSCQNGLNVVAIASMVGRERTIGAFVNFSADWLEPGRITYGARSPLAIGELDGSMTPRIEQLRALLSIFEPDTLATDNIFGYLWGKVAYGAMLGASALTNATMVDFISDAANRRAIRGLICEVVQVAQAEGVRPLGFQGFEPDAFLKGDVAAMDASIEANLAFKRRSAKTHSGYWRDLAVRKRPTDVGAQLAPVQEAARRRGMSTSMVDALVALVASVERRERVLGPELAAELNAHALEEPHPGLHRSLDSAAAAGHTAR